MNGLDSDSRQLGLVNRLEPVPVGRHPQEVRGPVDLDRCILTGDAGVDRLQRDGLREQRLCLGTSQEGQNGASPG